MPSNKKQRSKKRQKTEQAFHFQRTMIPLIIDGAVQSKWYEKFFPYRVFGNKVKNAVQYSYEGLRQVVTISNVVQFRLLVEQQYPQYVVIVDALLAEKQMKEN